MNKYKDFLKSFLIWFFVFYAILMVYEHFWGEEKENQANLNPEIVLGPIDDSMVIGNLALFRVENKLSQKIAFDSPCENPESLKVLRLVNDQSFDISSSTFAECGDRDLPAFSLEPGTQYQFSLKDFQEEFFSESGKYKLEMTYKLSEGEETKTVTSAPLEMESPGVFRQLFRAIVSKPLFNILVFLTQTLPNHTFGWAIVILTIIVRLLLFLPNQKAMKSQRELQKLQPKIEELKRKHGKNQQVMAMKTMELYRTHKINPMSSCLPMLLQLPFLLGIYYIVQDGLSPHLKYLLYGFQSDADLTMVDTMFFGLNLELNGPIFLAVTVGVAQWGAVKLSLISAKKKAKDQDLAPKEGMAGQMQQMNKIMLWVMPVMVAVFTTSFPAGIGIYWLTSTVFGIFQQKLVNWQLDKPQVVRKSEN